MGEVTTRAGTQRSRAARTWTLPIYWNNFELPAKDNGRIFPKNFYRSPVFEKQPTLRLGRLNVKNICGEL